MAVSSSISLVPRPSGGVESKNDGRFRSGLHIVDELVAGILCMRPFHNDEKVVRITLLATTSSRLALQVGHLLFISPQLS